MPSFNFNCPSCQATKSAFISIGSKKDILCDSCGSSMSKAFTPPKNGVIMESMTESKAWKIRRESHKKNLELEVRQMEAHAHKGHAIPNVGGEEVGSWSEAQDLARSKGLNAESYQKMVDAEKSSKNMARVDEKKYREAVERQRRGG